MSLRTALVQMCSGDDPSANAQTVLEAVRHAAAEGADIALTPEVTNCVSSSRSHQADVLRIEDEDITLATLRDSAAHHGIWILIGSLGLKTGEADGRFANRSFMIDPAGEIVARYDKAHMFDVDVDPQSIFRESAAYRPGSERVLAPGPGGSKLGLTICYDIRFPHLFRALAVAGAKIITVPAAFTVPTGRAHWEVLLRARAIETGSFVLAPAQTGTHSTRSGRKRESWGHSLAVSPWGALLCDAGEAPGVTFVDLDLDEVESARARIPSLRHEVTLSGPHA